MKIRASGKLLIEWRINAVIIGFMPALLISMLSEVGSKAWVCGVVVWAAVFLYVYLYYLPGYIKSISLELKDGVVRYKNGVLVKKSREIPYSNIQYVTVYTSILSRIFGLGSLRITTAGGKVMVAGLERKEAEKISDKLIKSGERMGMEE